jgi:putative transcriptional regulator
MKNQIKVERARKNMTQSDLAEALKVSRQTIHAIETSKFIPSTVLAMKMARYFGCTIEQLFELEDRD